MDSDIYIIVYPGSDKSRLSIVRVEQCNLHELEEYERASRHIFHTAKEVVPYAQSLALKHNLPLSSRDDRVQELLEKEDDGFLD